VGGGGVLLLVCAAPARQSDAVNRLKEKLLRLIHAQGSISVGHFMQIALTDSEHGYYMRHDPLGRDFITAPEVSQMFGELLGLFFVQAWEDRGRPSRFHLVELGPGRGTLMADLLRAAKIRPGFIAAARIWLVEVSPALRAIQEKTLHGADVAWASDLGGVPEDAPLLLIANEFFDALPVHQFVRMGANWHERMVSADGEELIFAAHPELIPAFVIPAHLQDAPPGAVFEISPSAQALAREIGRRVAQTGGVALLVDYGHSASALGDTFQAVQRHRPVAPLAEPGEADLTAHVDFAALAAAAREEGAQTFGPVTQGALLESLGIRARAQALKSAAPKQAAGIDAALDRLVDAEHMGNLFKALALAAPDTPPLPGFPC
jgi:NADH dehydrogenase [ubiquinone] 1 alpha subcomplex assembly factor 7